METYSYNPLKESRAVRFVRLLPSHGGPIHCQIFRASLEDKTEFIALSYAWGSTRKTKSIICNGRQLKVTDSLMSALLRLRKPDEPRIFWIDAICINQDDVAERNRQVSMIRDVYMKASKLFIWLGGGDQYSTSAVNLMHTLAAAQQNLTSTGIYKPCNVSPDQWLSFSKFLQRGWWERMWVIQELAFADKEGTSFLCGTHTFRVEDIKDACDWCNQIMFHMEANKELKSTFEVVLDGVRRVLVLCEMSNNSTPEEVREGLWRQWLLSRLADTRDKKATDPRDRLFALYGFLHHEGQAFAVADYSKSVGTVYHEFALDYILSCKSLDILSEVEEQKHRVLPQRVPSWVPDWSIKTHRLPILRESSNLGTKRREDQASGSVEPVIHALNDHVLLIDGIWFDDIVTVSEPLTHDRIVAKSEPSSTPAQPNSPEQNIILDLWHQVIRHLDPYPTGICAIEAYYKTLISGREERDKHMLNFVAFWKSLRSNAADPGGAATMDLQDFCLDTPEIFNLLCRKSVGAHFLDYMHELRDSAHAGAAMLAAIRIDDVFAQSPLSTSPARTNWDRGALFPRQNQPATSARQRGVSLNPGGVGVGKNPFMTGVRNASYKRFRNLVVSSAANRVLFTTRGGYVGLGAVGTRVGDEVCVLSGGKTPFVLRKSEIVDKRGLERKAPRSPLSPLKTYSVVASVVGEAYVHGIMKGEATEDGTWDRIALV